MDFNTLKDLLNPRKIIEYGGALAPLLVMGVIFAETGLLIGFFFPGDSLLFTAGLLVGTGDIKHFNIWLLLLGVFAAAVIGNTAGYLLGRSFGPKLFKKED